MHLHLSGHAVARPGGGACEDAWSARERDGVAVAALADGVGASREGGVAARRAVDMLVNYCLSRPRAWSARRALVEFTSQANRQLFAEARERFGTPELACTLSVVLLEGQRLYGCNVGDSPVYLWRRGRLEILSEPHTLGVSGLGHVLTRALGLEPTVEPFLFERELAEGDVVLLCSDGVGNALPAERIAELLSRRAAARSIVTVAGEAGCEDPRVADDSSAIVIDVLDLADAAASAGERLEVVPRLASGQRISGTTLLQPLTETERVWLAQADEGGRIVLKFPPAEAAEIESVRDAFVREAWNTTRLVSPDLVRAWIPTGSPFQCYAMEYLDAPTLQALLRAGTLPIEESCELARFLVRVSGFLLQHDLAHGDIKPDNVVVLRRAGAVSFRLLDLGSAAELFSVRSRAGTATYLAPERFHGAAISERTELFAMGVTLYQALTGTLPYGEIERFQTPRFDHAPKPPSRFNPAVPPWLEAIVQRATDPDPERRYQHYSEMAYDLEHPMQVLPYHRKDAPLLERDPLRFYQLLCVLLLLLNVALVALLAGRDR